MTAIFDREKIPYKVESLAELLKTIPKVQTCASDKDPVKKSQYPGVFTLYKDVFTSVETLDQFKYYVPFEDENCFTLDKFFGASGRGVLSRVDYCQIGLALGLSQVDAIELNTNVCYIRPRFVQKYNSKVTNFCEFCEERFKQKYTDNWLGFMSMVYETAGTGAYKFHQAVFTPNAQKALDLIFDYTEPWLASYISQPFLRRIAESVAKHRYNCNSVRNADNPAFPGYTIDYLTIHLSDEAHQLYADFLTLITWMFPASRFIEIYRNWINAVEEETISLLRSYPYLFKQEDELFYNSIILRRPDNPFTLTNNN